MSALAYPSSTRDTSRDTYQTHVVDLSALIRVSALLRCHHIKLINKKVKRYGLLYTCSPSPSIVTFNCLQPRPTTCDGKLIDSVSLTPFIAFISGSFISNGPSTTILRRLVDVSSLHLCHLYFKTCVFIQVYFNINKKSSINLS